MRRSGVKKLDSRTWAKNLANSSGRSKRRDKSLKLTVVHTSRIWNKQNYYFFWFIILLWLFENVKDKLWNCYFCVCVSLWNVQNRLNQMSIFLLHDLAQTFRGLEWNPYQPSSWRNWPLNKFTVTVLCNLMKSESVKQLRQFPKNVLNWW